MVSRRDGDHAGRGIRSPARRKPNPSIPVRFQVIERTVEELEHLETEPPPLDEAHWLEHSL
nr:hypothetical protein GCM10025699_37640 [Microbacterium flavescens]